MAKKKSKKVLIVSDLHSGHLVGLTPPSWQYELTEYASDAQKRLADVRKNLYSQYAKILKDIGKVDILICNGDAIDGAGKRSGGTECLTTDMNKQSIMAAECLNAVKAEQVYLVYGTPYHTGQECDFEEIIAEYIKASKYTKHCSVHSHLYLDVNGVMFDCKHKVGSSGLPHGRHTAVAKEMLANMLWNDVGVAPKSDIIVRSHVHYANFCGGPNHLALTTPALQGLGSKYGARQCSGLVDFGVTVFEITSKGEYSWAYKIPVQANEQQAVRVMTA